MKLWSDQKGAVVVLVAFGIVALLGAVALSVDVGGMYGTRANLVNAADASALAGAQNLLHAPDLGAAQSTAESYVSANAGSDATPSVSFSDDSTEITVAIIKTIDLHFAPVLSAAFATADIHAEATAKVGPAEEVPPGLVIPVAVLQEFYDEHKYDSEIIMDNESETPANWGQADLDGTTGGGDSLYREWLENGYDSTIGYDTIYTQTGFPSSTDGTLEDRLTKYGEFDDCTYEEAEPIDYYHDGHLCPRLVVIPVVDTWPEHGNGTTNVVGFAPFFIENTEADLSDHYPSVIGRFVDYEVTGGGLGNGTDYGLTTIALIK